MSRRRHKKVAEFDAAVLFLGAVLGSLFLPVGWTCRKIMTIPREHQEVCPTRVPHPYPLHVRTPKRRLPLFRHSLFDLAWRTAEKSTAPAWQT